MHRLFPAGIEALCAGLILAPVFYYLNKRRSWEAKRTVLCGIFALYLSAVYALAGLPNVLYIRFEPNFNFTPFAYMFSDWDATALNVLLFLPMGILLPLLWSRYRVWWRTVLLGFLASIFIETMQIFSFRATDVNDLMTNTLGTILGYFLAKLVLRLFPTPGSDDQKELGTVCALTFGVLFFLQPFLSRLVRHFLIP